MAGKKKEEIIEEKSSKNSSNEDAEEKTGEAVEKKASPQSDKFESEVKMEEFEKPEKVSKKDVEAKKDKKGKGRKRAEKIGIVWSDKMMKTVTVRVERLVKHQVYRKYTKKRKKFMAHDELGAGTGDRVRIVETRPLSARKRWRVVEIIQKAQK